MNNIENLTRSELEQESPSEISKMLKNFFNSQLEKIHQPADENQIEEFLRKKFNQLEIPKKETLLLEIKILGYPLVSGSISSPLNDSIINF